MAITFPTFRPGLRLVDSSGTPLAGFSNLAISVTDGAYQPGNPGAGLGLCLRRCRVAYVPEIEAAFDLNYIERWRILGFRPEIVLDFSMIECNNATSNDQFGLKLLRYLWQSGVSSQTYAALQFNLYGFNGSSPWRGVRPMNPFDPKPAEDREVYGFTWSMQLRCTSLSTTSASTSRWEDSKW